MEKKTLYALIVALALGAGALFTMRAPEKGRRTEATVRPVAQVKAADVVRLEITYRGQKTTLARKDDAWRVTAPGDWPADAAAVKALVEGLEKMTFGDLVTEGTAKHAEFAVADDKGTRVAAHGATGPLVDLYVGTMQNGFTLVRPVGKNEVWQANGFGPHLSAKTPSEWREHALVGAQPGDIDKLVVEGPSGKLVLSRAKSEPGKEPKGTEGWTIAEASGDAPKTSDALDPAAPSAAVQAFASLRADGFVDDKKPEQVGLDKPVVSVTAFVKDRAITVLIGAADGESVNVRVADAAQIYTVPKYSIERLGRSAADFRDKTLTKVKEADLASLTITVGAESLTLDRAGDKWTSKAKLPLDDAKVRLLATAFESLSGAGFATDRAPAKTGLGKPTATVSLTLKDKARVGLKVGALVGDDYFVQRDGSPDVLMVKKYQVERFLKKGADLK